MIDRRSMRSLRSVNWPRVMRLTSIRSSISRTSCEICRSITPVAWRAVSDCGFHPQDRRDVAKRRQGIAQLVRERGEEFVLQLRFVMQPVLAILDGGACFFRFIGAPLGFFLRLAQLPLDFLSLGDVDEQPLPFGGERRLLLPLQRDVAKRAEHAGQAAVGIAFGVGAILHVHEMPVLGDDARFAVDFLAGAGAAQRVLDVGAIVGMDQRETRAALQILERVAEHDLQPARRRVDDDVAAKLDARVKREVGRELADQPVEALAFTQARLLDQQPLARSIQVAAQPRDDERETGRSRRGGPAC